MVFWKLKQLRLHVVTHDAYEYLCQSCGKGFRSAVALQSHQRTHNTANNGEGGGIVDIISHDDEKQPFACDICYKRFMTKPNLSAHKRIHTGIREFTCDTCGKGFVQKGNLDNHMLTHLPSKPFNCEVCDKS